MNIVIFFTSLTVFLYGVAKLSGVVSEEISEMIEPYYLYIMGVGGLNLILFIVLLIKDNLGLLGKLGFLLMILIVALVFFEPVLNKQW